MNSLHLVLFAISGFATMVGGLLWTGLYGVPFRPAIGVGLFLFGATVGSAFFGLVDKEPNQPDDGPPN